MGKGHQRRHAEWVQNRPLEIGGHTCTRLVLRARSFTRSFPPSDVSSVARTTFCLDQSGHYDLLLAPDASMVPRY